MCWCDSLKVFAVFGETKSTQIVSQSMCRQHVVALFSVHPIAYKGCFFLDKKLYGDANELGIFSEILVVFSMRPRQIVGYNIKDFPLQCKVQFLENNGEPREVLVSDSSINNHELTPQKYFSIDGCWNSIEATMTDTIYLLRSAKKQDAVVIGDWAIRQIHIPFELKKSTNLSIQTMDEHVFLHSDGSGRILVVEGPFLACYYLLRTAKDQLTYKQQWRTRLWVDADFFNQFSQETELRSRSGRRITLTPPEFSKDDRLTLVEMHFDVDNRMIYAVCTCDMNSPVFDDANCQSTEMSRRNRSEDRGALVYILDDCDGEIINVIMQRSDVFEVMFMKFTTSGITAAIGTKGRGGAFVEVQQLSEMGVRNWRDNKRTKRKIHVK
ncbi:unnamed protein product [Anisakis simplex]|uniref:MMS1_N domain-containing protein n=1 Tax=Anisakis simplex TaxID=6269 RepID=A0A0M3KDH2_ANISI|nr:unnamed protein product [Anisakis simplex]